MKNKFLIFFLLLSLTAGLSGQTPTSVIEKAVLPGVTDELVREVDGRYLVTHSVSYGSPERHYFVLHDETFPNEYVMSCDLGQLLGMGESDRAVVKDMRVHDGRCYFCGYVRHYEGEPLYDMFGNITYSGFSYRGYVAYFDLAQMRSGGGRLWFHPVLNTDSLTRMVVYDPSGWSGDVMVAAIGSGIWEDAPAPLLLELQQQGGVWTSNLLTSEGERSDERYYDIAVSDGQLRIVSGFGPEENRAADERTSFLIHWCKKDGFYSQYAQSGTPEEAHYFPQLPQIGGNASYRLADMPIRMCSTRYDGCCVALGTLWESRNVGSPLLMSLDGADHMSYAEMYGYYGMAEARELVSSASTGITALLCRDLDPPVAERVVMSRMQAGTNVAELSWSSGSLGSLSGHGPTHLAVAGRESGSSRRLHLVMQDEAIAMGERTVSCAQLTNYAAWTPSLVQPQFELWKWYYRSFDWIWGIIDYTTASKHPEIICNRTSANRTETNNIE